MIVTSPAFLRQLQRLPTNAMPHILQEVEHLGRDPHPNGKTKVKLVRSRKGVCRVRSGKYRVLYVFGNGYVHVLGVDDRKDVYDGNPDALVPDDSFALPPQDVIAAQAASFDHGEFAVVPPAEPREGGSDQTRTVVAEWVTAAGGGAPGAGRHQQQAPEPLPLSLPQEFLQEIGVDPAYFDSLTACESVQQLYEANVPVPVRDRVYRELLRAAGVCGQDLDVLARCRTLDDLIAAPVAEAVRDRVFDGLCGLDYDRVAEGPKFIVNIEDLRRHAEGELVAFLLKLDSVQEGFVRRGLGEAGRDGTGPVLLKGSPGTGKTVIAAYRARELVHRLQRSGVHRPRILFTTYTNALVNGARQMVQQLLGEDAVCVTVCTVDSLVANILKENDEFRGSTDDGIVRDCIKKARDRLEKGSGDERALASAIQQLSLEYIREEIDRVIIGREHQTVEEYLNADRTGRRVRLPAKARHAVWRVLELRQELMEAKHHAPTFAENRRRAAQLVRKGKGPQPYDAVIIDEAQDLDPVAIRMLVALCKHPGGLFLTADANQSIYGAGFSWQRVHEDLRLTGRTSILRRNYRTTRQIAEAATHYLRGPAVEDAESVEIDAMHDGERPVLVRLGHPQQQMDELVTWLKTAARRQRVGIGCLAVLVPTNAIGKTVAEHLTEQGLPAQFMESHDVDLNCPKVKVLTFYAAKGLEFPVVAIAGLYPQGNFLAPLMAEAEEAEEKLATKRRTLYVAMCRAMRELCLLVPAQCDSPVLRGLDEQHWLVLEAQQAKAA